MKICKRIYFLYILKMHFLLSKLIINTTNSINSENNFIQNNTIYIIRTRNGDKNLEFKDDNSPIFLNDLNNSIKQKFLLILENENINKSENYYYIQDNESKNKIGSTKWKVIKKLSFELNEDNKDLMLWNIIPKNNSEKQLVYYVQNKRNKRYWELDSKNINLITLSKTNDINNLTINNEFKFVKLYKQSEKIETQILKDEPIDVLIKYIDLSDPNLIRKGIPQINKDLDNKELKFSIRSILKNIPWIRKIFILMPNEKVSYFKPYIEIKEKIVYIKDKDLLGFDSASSPSFQFNLHKMKKFGISENFILMDDDCFIANPLNKTDFFYEENGKVYPALITSDYYEMDKLSLTEKLNSYLSSSDNISSHSTTSFQIQHSRSLLLMYNIFGDDSERYGKRLIEPAYNHNSIPVKLSDIEEIHYYITKYYPYANDTLSALFRSPNSLQMQTTYMAYVKNQYDRKVSILTSEFYDLTHIRNIPRNTKDLFVINTGLQDYKHYLYTYARKNMHIIFPEKTKYELDDENDIDPELKDLMDIENALYKIIFGYVFRSNNRKMEKSNKRIFKYFNKVTKKFNYAEKIINELRNKNIKKISERNYTNILKKEIIYLKKQSQKLQKINIYLLVFIISFLSIKIYSYLIYIKEKRSKIIDRIDITL